MLVGEGICGKLCAKCEGNTLYKPSERGSNN